MQPGLLQYVESRFDVKDTGTAKYPGDDDRRPSPPYIFRARPVGSNGPFNLRLLIQPGPPGHILGVVDITKVHPTAPPNGPRPQPSVAGQPPPRPSLRRKRPASPGPPAPSASSSASASQQPSEPTADTPSGPIMDSGSQPSSAQPSLEPPPDPAPPAH